MPIKPSRGKMSQPRNRQAGLEEDATTSSWSRGKSSRSDFTSSYGVASPLSAPSVGSPHGWNGIDTVQVDSRDDLADEDNITEVTWDASGFEMAPSPHSHQTEDDYVARDGINHFETTDAVGESEEHLWGNEPSSQESTSIDRSLSTSELDYSETEGVQHMSPVFFRGGSDGFDDNDNAARDEMGNKLPNNAELLMAGDPNFANPDSEEEMDRLRLLAGQLSADWRGSDLMPPALARRIRDFQFAQEKRRKKYGKERPWGILGLYDHLAGIRLDVEWAEDAAWRRVNGQPYLAWADFEASKNTGFNRPFFTYIILLGCTGVLIASIGVNGWQIEPMSTNPMIGPSAETLVKMGAKVSYLIVNENEAWRLVSPMALHAGFIHYALNMLALWFIGSAVEQSHGVFATSILFVIPAVGGTILSAIFLPEYISVGASGGIFGLIGACLCDIVMNWKLLFSGFVNTGGKKIHHAMVLIFLILDIVVNCLLGLTPFVDNFTHLGGMVFGFLCGLSTMERVSPDFFGHEHGCWSQTKMIFFRFFGLIVSVAGVMAATVILLAGDGETVPCHSCSALSCVPFPTWVEDDKKWWFCDDCGVVTADARIDPETGKFDQLGIDCPDGDIVYVDLTGESTADQAWLESKLPSYCREYCEGTHKSR